jgi:hypothetical protein
LNEPVNPAGHACGWQHVPSVMHSEPVGHVMHVIGASPHPGSIGWHDDVANVAHVSGSQQRPSSHLPVAHVAHSSALPVHGSVHVPHRPAGQAVAGAQQLPPLQCVRPSPLLAQSSFCAPQSSALPVHGSVRVSHSSSEHGDGAQQ